jgi:hypothetical protein
MRHAKKYHRDGLVKRLSTDIPQEFTKKELKWVLDAFFKSEDAFQEKPQEPKDA